LWTLRFSRCAKFFTGEGGSYAAFKGLHPLTWKILKMDRPLGAEMGKEVPYSLETLYKLAKAERLTCIAFLLQLLGMFAFGFQALPGLSREVVGLISAASGICQLAVIYGTYKMVSVMGRSGLRVIFMFVPLLGLLVLVRTLYEAHQNFKQAGISVGLLGPSLGQFKDA